MNQKEIDKYIQLFKKCHQEFVVVFPKNFLARHRYHLKHIEKGMAIVWEDDQVTPAMIVYFDKVIHPAEFNGNIQKPKK